MKPTRYKNLTRYTPLGYGSLFAWLVIMNLFFGDNGFSDATVFLVYCFAIVAGIAPVIIFWNAYKKRPGWATRMGIVLSFIPFFFSLIMIMFFFNY
jgi:hypothetical protein